MTIQAQVEGLGTLEFPDGTDPAVIQATIKKQIAAKPKENPVVAGVKQVAGDIAGPIAGAEETASHLGSAMIAAPVAGIAGIARGATNLGEEALGLPQGRPAADVVGDISQAMTYQPRTQAGKAMSGAVDTGLSYLSEKPGEFTGSHATDLLTKAGAPPWLAAAGGATVKTATEIVPQMLLAKGAGAGIGALKAGAAPAAEAAGAESAGAASAAPGASNAAASAARAQAYVGSLGLDWNALSEAFKAKLTGIAQDATALGKLNPAATKRQAVLASVGIDNPTRGQVTREPLQQRTEQLVKGTQAGQELRDLDVEHNAKLLAGVENLRQKVTAETLPSGSKARGDLPVGRSVQDTALRKKAEASEKRYENLYKVARKTEPDASVPVDPLYELLQKSPSLHHIGWMSDWLKREGVEKTTTAPDGTEVTERRPVKLDALYDLRVKANQIIKGGGPDAHYAADVKAAIDGAFDQVPEAAKAWKAATDAFRQHKQEFADQGAVRGLVEDKPQSSDRRVAIEETARKTVTGKLEDLQKVKRSLLTGRDATARQAGKIAWRDLKGWGLDYIRERMTKGTTNEAGDPHATWVGLKTALDNIGDENLDELYGPTVRKQLRRYQEASEYLFTESSTRVKGSPTLDKVLTFLDRIGGWVPGSHYVTGTLKGVSKVGELGKAGREVREAKTTPIDEQLSATRRDVRRSQNLSAVKKYAPAAPAAESRPEE